MSYPDSSPSPYPFISSPSFPTDNGGAIWPAFWMSNEQQQQQQQQQQPQPDLMSQFDRPPLKRPRMSEKPSNFPPFQQPNPRVNPPNIPGGKGTSHIFFKTRMCAKFLDGTCPNGDQCTFAHGVGDLREPPPNWQDLIREKDNRAGPTSSNWGGSGDHRMIHRMKICKKYYNGEECPYGDKCNFLHERPSSSSPPMKRFNFDVPEQRESSAISIGVTGNDARGSGSDFDSKVFWKTRLCSKWEMGQCPFGDRCHYAHGQSELKTYGTTNEPETAKNSVFVPKKQSSVSAFITAPADPLVVVPLIGNEEDKKLSKWKATKKINRIYADWLDDLTPPYCSPGKEEL